MSMIVLEFSAAFELNKIAVYFQQISLWFRYDMLITCEMVSEDKLGYIWYGREEPNPHPSLDITGQHVENPTASAHQIEQQVERATQSITDHLVDYVNWQVG